MLGCRTSQAGVSSPPPQVSHCSLNQVMVSSMMCCDPRGITSTLLQHTPSNSFKDVKSWTDCGPGFPTVSQVPEGIYPIAQTVLWLQKEQ